MLPDAHHIEALNALVLNQGKALSALDHEIQILVAHVTDMKQQLQINRSSVKELSDRVGKLERKGC